MCRIAILPTFHESELVTWLSNSKGEGTAGKNQMIFTGLGRNVGSPEGVLAACALSEVSFGTLATSRLPLGSSGYSLKLCLPCATQPPPHNPISSSEMHLGGFCPSTFSSSLSRLPHLAILGKECFETPRSSFPSLQMPFHSVWNPLIFLSP